MKLLSKNYKGKYGQVRTFLKKRTALSKTYILLISIYLCSISPSNAQKQLDTTAKWEIGYIIFPNIKTIFNGESGAGFLVKNYGKTGLNALRFKLSFYGNAINKAQTTGLADSSDYNNSRSFTIEGRVGKEWSKTILSNRAKVFFGVDLLYKLYHKDAGVFTNSGIQKTATNENVSAYGTSPFFGATYGISKGLAISIETHINLLGTSTRRTFDDPSLSRDKVKYRQNGLDIDLLAIDMLYISLRF